MAHSNGSIQKKIILAVCGLTTIFILCFLVLKFMYTIQNTTLQSTWRSEETGQVLTFTEHNSVEFEGNLPSGIYHILSPSTMEYTIDGKTFQMLYRIEKNKLYWGLDKDHLECFVRTWY